MSSSGYDDMASFAQFLNTSPWGGRETWLIIQAKYTFGKRGIDREQPIFFYGPNVVKDIGRVVKLSDRGALSNTHTHRFG